MRQSRMVREPNLSRRILASALLVCAVLVGQMFLPLQSAKAGSIDFTNSFDGSSASVINIAGDPKLEPGFGAFTLEMWVKENHRTSDPRYDALFWGSTVFGQYRGPTAGALSLQLTWDCVGFAVIHSGQSCPYMAGRDDPSAGALAQAAYYTLFEDHAWHHIAISKAGAGGDFGFYLDGLRVAHATSDTNNWWLDGGDLVIGAGFDGSISNVRLVKGQGLYSGPSITVPTSELTLTSQGAIASNVSLLITSKGSNCLIQDSSQNHFTIRNSGVACNSSFSPATAYNVTFDNQGHGTKPVDANGVTSLALADLPAENTEGNFNFVGWSQTATGSVLTGPFTPTADATLYGIWHETIIMADVPNIVGLSTADASTGLGANFVLGSAQSATTVGATALNNGKIATQSLSGSQRVGSTIDYTTYLYIDPCHTVTYDLAGGTYDHTAFVPTQASGLPESKFTIAAAGKLQKTGFRFYKWFDGTNYYKPGSRFTMASTNVVLTAVWTQKAFKISWDNRPGGRGCGGQTSYLTGEAVSYVRPNPTRTRYIFAGWYTGKNGSGDRVTAGYVVANPFGNVNFYADWQPKTDH